MPATDESQILRDFTTIWRQTSARGWCRFVPAPLTLLLTLGVAIIVALPAVVPALEFDRHAIATGDWGRMITGHLTHWTLDHAFWDGAMFLALGTLCEVRWPRRFLACLAGAPIVISVALWCGTPELNTYRGLSGIDSALFTLAVGCLLCEAVGEGRRNYALLLTALLVAFAGKIGYEFATGATLFVDSTTAFVPIPLAHIAGGAVGIVAALAGHRAKWQLA